MTMVTRICKPVGRGSLAQVLATKARVRYLRAMTAAAIIVVALALGATLGRRLAARGLTAQNALVGRQLLAYAILIFAGGAGLLLFYAPRLAWMPTVAVLYGEGAVLHAARAAAAFALTLLITLEWPGRREPKRRRQLLVGGAALLLLAGYLGFRAIPLRLSVERLWIHDGVVMQSTAYTCAPASIATLVRWFGGDTLATEASVASIAGTTREGTSTFAEVRTMRRLGFAPRYARRLTPESLAVAGYPALLHVDEPVASGVTIRHAVALLEVNHESRTVLVGNPLHGRQVKRFGELEGYWTGEAVFVTTHRLRPPS